MTAEITLPLWAFVLLVLFAAVTFASHFLFPSVRWFLRRRLERAVAQLNTRLDRPIQPFKLLARHDMILRLSYDPEVLEAVRAHAAETGLREDVSFQKARRYAREIVPSFSAFAYFGLAIRGARFLSNALYRVRLGHHAEAALRDVDPEATVVFVMNHRSNMDYVLVTYLAAERSALSYAVGEWARVWPLSRLIKAMGAYFIRRRSRNALYRKVLARYVHMATANGVTQAMFPEGGLSLDGALQAPKVGLLKYIVEGADSRQRDVVFVPVGLNYDRVLEDRVLVKAGAGQGRRFDAGLGKVTAAAVKQVWLRLTGRFHRFGYAAVSFGAPLSLRAARDKRPEALAEEVMRRIAAIVPVLPVPLIAHILLTLGPMSRPDLERAFREVTKDLPHSLVHLPRDSVGYAVEVGLRSLTERGVATEEGGVWAVPDETRDLAQYYARSIAHHLHSSAGAA